MVGRGSTPHREAAALYVLIGREFGLTTQQAQLLCVLTSDRPSFSELATTLGRDRTNVTGMSNVRHESCRSSVRGSTLSAELKLVQSLSWVRDPAPGSPWDDDPYGCPT
ncbi:hypothetical protein SVIO_006910 [Streptomyces violaceusniger]|uniref:Uncharacterized protein n=1 Tax=Streptomyces violaceusniger TaxID=68280 RepID=A0A4D4KUJ5_STRVO|nr:hypothetical protein SVIO_006910 [Streptomyces violaceusniger]